MKKGIQTISNSLEFFKAYPICMVPLLVVWCLVLIYMALATSGIFLMEQLYTAQLYLWHQNWAGSNQHRNALSTLPKSHQPTLFKPFFQEKA